MIEQFLIRQSVLGSVTNLEISAGTLSSNRSDVTFADSNGVSFGLNTNGVITASVAATAQGHINVSAGSTSSNVSAVTFSNANGVSFGYDGSNITATVRTNYQSAGAYLTTAMASNRGSDFVQATAAFFGTNASGTIASNAISISVSPSAGSLNLSAGTTSSNISAVTFSNANGVSFGFDGSNVTATVATNYQSQGAYLTTAALSQDSSKYAGTGFTTATTAGVNIVGTLNTAGISMGVPAYLTTAMQSNAATISNINVSAGTTSNNLSAITFSNSNNVSFGLNGSTLTGSIATTYAGTGITTTTTAGTAVVGTLNASGLSLGVPAYLTTAALSGDSSKYAGTGFTTATTAGTAIVGTLNTAGISMGVPAYLTTAMQSNAATISNIKISAGTLSQTRSDITFADSNGVSWGLNTNGVVTASIATTYAGTGFTSTTTAGTAIVGTLNTSGLSLGVPAYLTTAALSADSSKYAGTNTSVVTTAGTDLTFAVNTSGVTIAYPKWITAAAAAPITFSASNTSFALNTIAFSNSNGVSFGLGTGASSTIMSASIATTYAGTGFTTATTAGTAIVGTLNTSGLSLGVPAYLTTAEQSRQPLSYFANFYAAQVGVSNQVQSNTFYVLPLSVQEKVSMSYIRLLGNIVLISTTIATSAVNNATGASTAFSLTVDMNAVLYSVGTGANSRSLQYVTSGKAGWTWAASVSQASTSNASNQSFTQAITYPSEGFDTAVTSGNYSVSATNGPISTTQFGNLGANNAFLDIPLACSLSAGNYWLALNKISGTVGGKNIDINYSTYGTSGTNLIFRAMNQASNVSNAGPFVGLGSWTTNVAQTSSSIAFASISFSSSHYNPYVQFINQA